MNSLVRLVKLVGGDDVEGESGDVVNLELDLLHCILLNKVVSSHYRRCKGREKNRSPRKGGLYMYCNISTTR